MCKVASELKGRSLDLHLLLHDHACQSFGDNWINGLKFLLSLHRLRGVANHKIADRVVEVKGRFIWREGNRFFMESQRFFSASGLGQRQGQAVKDGFRFSASVKIKN